MLATPAARTARHPTLVLIGTGGEVWVCVDAAELLAAEGISVRVVSMPCWETLRAQDDELPAHAVLPAGVPTLAVEAGDSFGWDRWADDSVGIDHFGASAPGATVLEQVRLSPPSTWPTAARATARRRKHERLTAHSIGEDRR